MNMTTPARLVPVIESHGFMVDTTTGECIDRHLVEPRQSTIRDNVIINFGSVTPPVEPRLPNIHYRPNIYAIKQRAVMHNHVGRALDEFHVYEIAAHQQVFNACMGVVNAGFQARRARIAQVGAWLYINQFRFVSWNKTMRATCPGNHKYLLQVVAAMRHEFRRGPGWKPEAARLLATGMSIGKVAKRVGVYPSTIYQLPHPSQRKGRLPKL
jgi:hypothetical protein